MSGSRTWARAVAAVREAPPPAVPTLIHRDYHPENTLWSRGRLTGVVDWTQASWGPPELDVAHMRWNLAADHGQQVADEFLACYRAITGRALGTSRTGTSSASSTSCSTAIPTTPATSGPMTSACSRPTPRPRSPGSSPAGCG